MQSLDINGFGKNYDIIRPSKLDVRVNSNFLKLYSFSIDIWNIIADIDIKK